MNFRYDFDAKSPLEEAVSRYPHASLYDIQQLHPTLRRASLDHLALRISQIRQPQRPVR
jgi:hypothetical protein